MQFGTFPFSINSLISTTVSRQLLSSTILSRGSPGYPSLNTMTSNKHARPWLLHTNDSFYPYTHFLRKGTMMAWPYLLLTRLALCYFHGPFHVTSSSSFLVNSLSALSWQVQVQLNYLSTPDLLQDIFKNITIIFINLLEYSPPLIHILWLYCNLLSWNQQKLMHEIEGLVSILH